ncbi:LysR family transcriptional regulator [Novacetimonas hansenii]|uniref:Transcriptional regulator n=2 Tax=Novacetimonas hansenii TaxID=436 RepID=A0ABQ0SCL8_NOVHA|nr:LysR family transcriptional regulator [Novacetimonas hansenii]EFG84129.1 transcriptional regulator, LysR family protein [Novacetimonas hansenii ATCC 23769]GAN84511.1 transcriptional regulator LysR [Novacetimonas hansenii JCM 7643]GBQ55036.1 transcriptional regulator [Novacetimonas hansenii NRIC 0243]GEC62928.1 transcriptional regulator [Novacetimonas hansenii]
MDNRAGEMQVFVRVAEAGSFSEAARHLLMTPSTVSKLIGRMEERLGVRLIERSTRRLSLTDEGRLFHERSAALLAELNDIEREVCHGAGGASGIVRVSASVPFGVLGIEPLLPEFWRTYPNVIVDLSLSDEIVDLYLDRTDIAFRVGPLTDSSLLARKIGVARRQIVASPDYLKNHGTPITIDDLNHHNCLGFNFRRAAPVWPLREGRRIVDRMVGGSLLANNGETVRRLVLAGVGLARLGDFHVRDDIAHGHLVEVLADAGHGDAEDVHALYLGGQRMPQRIRLFLDFMVPRLQAFMRNGV